MSGRRCRALAAAFEARFGRAPNRTTWEKGGYHRSEWRRLKKGARHEASAATVRVLAKSTSSDARRFRKGEARRRRRADRVVAAA